MDNPYHVYDSQTASGFVRVYATPAVMITVHSKLIDQRAPIPLDDLQATIEMLCEAAEKFRPGFTQTCVSTLQDRAAKAEG